MKAQALFYETWQDAAREVVAAAGGPKKVGPTMWPAKTQLAAVQRLNDCLNPGRAEHFSPDEFLLLLRIGHDAGCHALMRFVAQDTAYAEPQPVSPADERARLQAAFVDAMQLARTLVDRMEGLAK